MIGKEDQTGFDFNGFELEKNPTMRQAAINKLLNDTQINQAQYITTFKSLDKDRFRVEMTYAKIDYEKPPENEIEEFLRAQHENMIGEVWLRGQISNTGKLGSFFLLPGHSNILSLFFQFSNSPVRLNEPWSIPVNLIEFGPNFRTDEQKRISKVSIIEIKNTQTSKIATVFYNIAEYVKGGFLIGTENKFAPQTIMVSFIAVGQFDINKSIWKSYRGYLIGKQQGMISQSQTKLYALEPITN